MADTETPKLPSEGGVYLRDKNGALRTTEKATEIRDPMGRPPEETAPAPADPPAAPEGAGASQKKEG